MAEDRPDEEEVEPVRGGRQVPPARDLALERARREAIGKNWEARHVADLLDLSELTVKRMARRGKLPAVKIGRGWEFPPDKVRAWYAGESWASRPPPLAAKPDKK